MLNRVFLIKSIHSLIFFFMLASLLYILYAGLAGVFNWLLVIALAAILIEGIVLIFNNWKCPLAALAEKLGAEKGSVVDIFLPAIVARNSIKWFTALFAAEVALLGIRYFIG